MLHTRWYLVPLLTVVLLIGCATTGSLPPGLTASASCPEAPAGEVSGVNSEGVCVHVRPVDGQSAGIWNAWWFPLLPCIAETAVTGVLGGMTGMTGFACR